MTVLWRFVFHWPINAIWFFFKAENVKIEHRVVIFPVFISIADTWLGLDSFLFIITAPWYIQKRYLSTIIWPFLCVLSTEKEFQKCENSSLTPFFACGLLFTWLLRESRGSQVIGWSGVRETMWEAWKLPRDYINTIGCMLINWVP